MHLWRVARPGGPGRAFARRFAAPFRRGSPPRWARGADSPQTAHPAGPLRPPRRPPLASGSSDCVTLRGGGVRGRGGAIRLYGETESETRESRPETRDSAEKNESRASARLETFAVFAYG